LQIEMHVSCIPICNLQSEIPFDFIALPNILFRITH